MLVDIGGKSVNPEHVVSAEVENRFYMNGSASFLVVCMDDGSRYSHEHGYGFDAHATLKKLQES